MYVDLMGLGDKGAHVKLATLRMNNGVLSIDQQQPLGGLEKSLQTDLERSKQKGFTDEAFLQYVANVMFANSGYTWAVFHPEG